MFAVSSIRAAIGYHLLHILHQSVWHNKLTPGPFKCCPMDCCDVLKSVEDGHEDFGVWSHRNHEPVLVI